MTDKYWQTVLACNYCSSDSYTLYLRSPVPSWYKKQPLELVQCTSCGLVRALYRPDPDILYQRFLAAHDTAQIAVERKLNRPNVDLQHERAVERAMKHVESPTRLFDMGCGAGTVMEAAKRIGLEAEGNDINLAGVERLRELGFTAYHGFTSRLELPSESFDIVINFDYLEHSFEPYEDLLTCYDLLRDGGVIYLKTLYLDCPDHILKDDGYQLFGQGHFHYFFPRTLCSMLNRAGFEILELQLGGLINVIARKGPQSDTDEINRYEFRVVDTGPAMDLNS